MKLSRRSFMKANAVAAAAAAAGLSVPGVARAVVGQQEAIKWDKAPCRFAERVAVCWWERSRAVWSPAGRPRRAGQPWSELH